MYILIPISFGVSSFGGSSCALLRLNAVLVCVCVCVWECVTVFHIYTSMEITHTRTHANALSHAYTLIPAHSEIIGQCATSSFCTSCFMILRLAEEPIALPPPPPSSNWNAVCSRFGNTRGSGVSATRFRDVVLQIGAWSRMCVRASVCGCGWVVGVRQHTDRVGVGERGGAEWGRVRGGHGAATEHEKDCGLYVSSDHGRVAAGRRVNIFDNWIHRRHMVFAGPRTCRYKVLESFQ